MSGIELRVVQIHSRDGALGHEGKDAENSGAVELWRDGQRIVEMVWWEQAKTDVASLELAVEAYGHVTYASDIHFGFAAVRS